MGTSFLVDGFVGAGKQILQKPSKEKTGRLSLCGWWP